MLSNVSNSSPFSVNPLSLPGMISLQRRGFFLIDVIDGSTSKQIVVVYLTLTDVIKFLDDYLGKMGGAARRLLVVTVVE